VDGSKTKGDERILSPQVPVTSQLRETEDLKRHHSSKGKKKKSLIFLILEAVVTLDASSVES